MSSTLFEETYYLRYMITAFTKHWSLPQARC